MKNDRFLLGRCVSCELFVYNDEFKDKKQLEKFGKVGLCLKCQDDKSRKYTVLYYIEKFSAIPDEQWTESEYNDGEKYCALGHCGEIDSDSRTDESAALDEIFNKYDLRVSLVNDGKCAKYNQDTPKARILAALIDIRNMEDSFDF